MLNGDRLGVAMFAAMQEQAQSGKRGEELFKALGNAIVAEITAHAEVTTTVLPTDTGLQAYVVPPAGPVPTVGNALAPSGVVLGQKGTVA